MFVDAPDESSVDGEVADWYGKQRDAWGYLPNYAPAFATRPDVARAWTTLNNAIRGHMERRRFELVTIAADQGTANLAATDRAVMDFATQVARDASSIDAEDVQQLRGHGLSDPEIVDVVFAAAARAFFTKVLDALGVQADVQLGNTFDPDVRRQVTVGRPIADS